MQEREGSECSNRRGRMKKARREVIRSRGKMGNRGGEEDIMER